MRKRQLQTLLAACLAAIAVPCTAHATAPVPSCPVEHAHYRYSGGDGEADLSVLPKLSGFMSKVLLHVRVAGKNDFWFLFDQGSGRYVHLVSITDPHRPGWTPPDPDGGDRPLPGQTFIAWNDALKVAESMPRQGAPAPGYFLLPDLPETLWYRMRDGKRIDLAAGIFRLDRCD
jgi:hypothetical protein